MSKKSGWLLQLIDEEPIDPIRIQKGMFLFAQEAGAPVSETYSFVPYNWGPCAFEIYGDLEHLLEQGFIERVPVAGATWHRYRRTDAGTARARLLAQGANKQLVKHVQEIGASVKSKGFERLLRDVYKKYPKYASKSLLKS